MNPIKNIIKHFWYSFRDLFIPKSKGERVDNSLVIIRLDAIGDYILFRNFLEIIRKSTKYKDYQITLIGNKVWKPIAEKLDNEWIDRFIWIDLKAFHKSLSDRKKSLLEIEDTTYDILFHPTYSRDYYISELIAKRVNAITKIASVGDLSNTSKWQKGISDKQYSKFIDSNELFEFSRNKQIVEVFIDQNINLIKPHLDSSGIEDHSIKSDNYITLFIGGGAEFRRWSIEKWTHLISDLLDLYNFDIVIAGGPEDKTNGEVLKNHYITNDRVINSCGKTTLNQLISLISKSIILLSNETSAVHIAASLDTPVLVISNGNHYGRFTPYPNSKSTNYVVVYPPEIEREENTDILLKRYSSGSELPIDSIDANVVLEKIKELQAFI